MLFQAAIPFAVVGSNTVVEVAGKKVRGRMYQWGIVEGEVYHGYNMKYI
jgi:septin family protein